MISSLIAHVLILMPFMAIASQNPNCESAMTQMSQMHPALPKSIAPSQETGRPPEFSDYFYAEVGSAGATPTYDQKFLKQLGAQRVETMSDSFGRGWYTRALLEDGRSALLIGSTLLVTASKDTYFAIVEKSTDGKAFVVGERHNSTSVDTRIIFRTEDIMPQTLGVYDSISHPVISRDAKHWMLSAGQRVFVDGVPVHQSGNKPTDIFTSPKIWDLSFNQDGTQWYFKAINPTPNQSGEDKHLFVSGSTVSGVTHFSSFAFIGPYGSIRFLTKVTTLALWPLRATPQQVKFTTQKRGHIEKMGYK